MKVLNGPKILSLKLDFNIDNRKKEIITTCHKTRRPIVLTKGQSQEMIYNMRLKDIHTV